MSYHFNLNMLGESDMGNRKEKLYGSRVVRGTLHLPPGGAKAVQGTLLICHGFKGFKDWGFFPFAAEQLAILTNLNVIRFNFSHNGVGADMGSFSEPERFAVNTYEREQEDLAAVMALVHSEAFMQWKEQLYASLALSDPIRIPSFDSRMLVQADHLSNKPIYILGHSRGGATALLYALHNSERIAGILTWNGVTNVDLFSNEQKESLRTTGRSQVINARTGEALPLDAVVLEDLERNVERYQIIERMSTAQFPLIMVQGSNDLPGFCEGSSRLQQQYKEAEWVIIDEAGHTFQAVHPFQGTTRQLNEAIEHSALWLKKQLQLRHT
ncbi:alpha/beta hydrolase family protein [Paenibacillus agilis]|nr:alpha/beta hydrolase [Paenibacillus agilis]